MLYICTKKALPLTVWFKLSIIIRVKSTKGVMHRWKSYIALES
jgi:hypothetical protein